MKDVKFLAEWNAIPAWVDGVLDANPDIVEAWEKDVNDPEHKCRLTDVFEVKMGEIFEMDQEAVKCMLREIAVAEECHRIDGHDPYDPDEYGHPKHAAGFHSKFLLTLGAKLKELSGNEAIAQQAVDGFLEIHEGKSNELSFASLLSDFAREQTNKKFNTDWGVHLCTSPYQFVDNSVSFYQTIVGIILDETEPVWARRHKEVEAA